MNLRVEEEASPTHGGLWFQTGWQLTPYDTGLCPNDMGLGALPGNVRPKK